jgi:hypothetical protein
MPMANSTQKFFVIPGHGNAMSPEPITTVIAEKNGNSVDLPG